MKKYKSIKILITVNTKEFEFFSQVPENEAFYFIPMEFVCGEIDENGKLNLKIKLAAKINSFIINSDRFLHDLTFYYIKNV